MGVSLYVFEGVPRCLLTLCIHKYVSQGGAAECRNPLFEIIEQRKKPQCGTIPIIYDDNDFRRPASLNHLSANLPVSQKKQTFWKRSAIIR